MKHSMKKRKSMNKKRGGGCGCAGSKPPSFFSGGKKRRTRRTRKMKGGNALGPASLTNYDPSNTYTYALKDEGLNPLNPNQITDSRGLPNTYFSGGKRKQKKRGGSTDIVLQNYSANPISNFATNSLSGALTGAHIVTGELIPTTSYEMLDAPKPFL